MSHEIIEFTEEQIEKYLEDPKNVLQVFMSTFVEKYGYDHNKVKATLGNTSTTQTMWKSKMWTKTHTDQAMIGLQHKTFSFILAEGTTDSIELYMIEAKMQNRGIGTRVMEQLLDLADEIGINITLVPTPYKNVNDEKYCSFLRQWYYDLGFDNSPLSPTMTYNAQK